MSHETYETKISNEILEELVSIIKILSLHVDQLYTEIEKMRFAMLDFKN